MDFSDKLDELKGHVDEVQASVEAAATETRDNLQHRIESAQRDFDEQTKGAREDVLKASDATRSKWDQVKADASAKLASAKSRADQRADAIDAKFAATDADAARADAYAAIDFANWAVDNARIAMLDAIEARSYADELASPAHV